VLRQGSSGTALELATLLRERLVELATLLRERLACHGLGCPEAENATATVPPRLTMPAITAASI
jgi:hypothetical protein